MEIYTIGHTKKTAEEFFGRLKNANIRRLVDTRLRSGSQLAGFAKSPDLQYFLRELSGTEYRAESALAPTAELLDAYRKRQIDWDRYAEEFVGLLTKRKIEELLSPADFTERTVLLCSEARPDRCHRRLAAEYLIRHWPDLSVVHL